MSNINEFEQLENLIAEQKYSEAIKIFNSIQLNKATYSQIKQCQIILKKIPMEERCKTTKYIMREIFICRHLSDENGLNNWINHLVGRRKVFKEGTLDRQKLEENILVANLFKLKNDNAQSLMLLATLSENNIENYADLLCCATARRPSVLRGAKDCAEWVLYFKAISGILKPVIKKVFDEADKGIVELALAEMYLEKGDINNAFLSFGGAMISEMPEIKFASCALLARLYLLDNKQDKTDEMLAQIGNFINEENAQWLLPNYQAFCAEIAVGRGEVAKVEEWLKSITDIASDKVCVETEYINIVRAKAMMTMQNWQEAALLLQGLVIYFEEKKRTIDVIECNGLAAMVYSMLENDDMAFSAIERALKLASNYGFVTIITEKGGAMAKLLTKYLENNTLDDDYRNYVFAMIEKVKKMSVILPCAYNISLDELEGPPKLTDMEFRTLKLLESGAPNKEIAAELKIKITTVKFHVSNLLEKFAVTNRVELINKARNFNLLSN